MTDRRDETMWPGAAEMIKRFHESLSANKQADARVEDDPLLEIARMRAEEQQEIMKDQKKLQEMRMEHLKKINQILKKTHK